MSFETIVFWLAAPAFGVLAGQAILKIQDVFLRRNHG